MQSEKPDWRSSYYLYCQCRLYVFLSYKHVLFNDSINKGKFRILIAIEGLQLDTLDADRLKKIRDLESYARPKLEEIEPEMQRPVFLSPLNRFLIYLFIYFVII